MKVVHFLKTSIGATWGLRQMRELVKLGVEVHVVLPDGPLVRKYQDVGVSTHLLDASLSFRQPFANFSKFKAIRRIVKELNPDLIHSHFVATTLSLRLALGRKHPVKRIFHVPGPLHLEHAIYRAVDILSAGKSDYWLASCQWTRSRYIRSGVERERLGLVYYGVDLPKKSTGRTGNLRKEYGLSAQTPVVGNVAFFYPPKRYLGQKVGLKGHEDLIQAIDIVGEKIPGLVCFLVGGPWGNSSGYYEKVKSLADSISNARVIMTGFRDDVHDIYQDFDVAVHPSHSENVGGAVESLLHEVPTIATNIGGFPDLIQQGKTGWLVPAKSPVDLADAILEALTERNKGIDYAKSGRKLVEELLDVRRNAKDIKSYYSNLLSTGFLTPQVQDE